MRTYLEVDIPEELCEHLFMSFKRKVGQCSLENQQQSSSISQLSNLGKPYAFFAASVLTSVEMADNGIF